MIGLYIKNCLFLACLLLLTAGRLQAAPLDARICFERWQPYIYMDGENRLQGPIYDIIQHIVAKAGGTAHFDDSAYRRCMLGIETGIYNMTLMVSPDTKGLVVSDTMLAEWSLGAFVPASSDIKNFVSMEQFRGARVGLIYAYEYPPEIWNYASTWASELRIPYSGPSDSQEGRLFKVLEAERIDVVFVDRGWAEAIGATSKRKVRALEPEVVMQPNYIGYRADAIELTSYFETELKRMAASGELAEFYTRHGVDVPAFNPAISGN